MSQWSEAAGNEERDASNPQKSAIRSEVMRLSNLNAYPRGVGGTTTYAPLLLGVERISAVPVKPPMVVLPAHSPGSSQVGHIERNCIPRDPKGA